MTVAELIAKLQTFPQHFIVQAFDAETEEFEPAEPVNVDTAEAILRALVDATPSHNTDAGDPVCSLCGEWIGMSHEASCLWLRAKQYLERIK